MVEKRTRTPNTTQTKQPKAHKPSLHHHVVFPLCWVKRGERKLMTGNRPEFTNEKYVGAGLCSSKVSKKASKGLYFMITSDQRPHHSAAKPWSRCRSGVSQCSNVGCLHVKMEWRSYAVCRGKDLSCGTTHATGCTYKSRGMLPVGDHTVAAIANDESLQVRVRKAFPPEGRSTQHSLALKGGKNKQKRGVFKIRPACSLCCSSQRFFFHKCGRRVDMVSRSSLKEEKDIRWWRRGQKQPNNNQTTPNGRVSTILQSFLCAQVKQVKRKLLTVNGPEFSNEEHGSMGLCSSKVYKKYKWTLLNCQ